MKGARQWTSFPASTLHHVSRGSLITCSTPNKSKNRLEKTKDLQWSSSPVKKSERMMVLSDVDALHSEVPTEASARNASVGKHQQSYRKVIDFDMESSDEIMQPTSARKRKVPACLQTTETKKTTREVVDVYKKQENIINKQNTSFTKKDVDTFRTILVEDTCNSYFELESSDEEFIKKNIRRPQTPKTSGKLNHSKATWKEKSKLKALSIKHVGDSTPEKKKKKSAQSNISQLTFTKTCREKHTKEPGNQHESLPSRSIRRMGKQNLDPTSPRRLTVNPKRISFALTKEQEATRNSEAPESKVHTGMRRSSRPRAATTAFWLGEKASYNANNSTLTTATDHGYQLLSNNLPKSERDPLKKRAQPAKDVKSRQGYRATGSPNKKPVSSMKKKKGPYVTERVCVLGVGLEDVEFCLAEDDDPNGALYATSVNTYNMEAGYIKLPAGTRTGNLISAEHNKLYTVLENAVSLNIDGVLKEICPFGQFHVDKGVVHEIINESNSSASLLQYVVIYY